MLSWAGGGYSDILSDAREPLMTQKDNKNLQPFVNFFKEDLLFF